MKIAPIQFVLLRTVLLLILCYTTSAHAAKSIVVLGDSLSAGYGINVADGWVSLLQKKLPQYNVINASISGETTAGGKQRIHDTLRQHQPTLLIVELGANDGLRGSKIKDITQNLADIIEAAQKNNTRVLLLGMKLPPNYGAAYTQKFEQMYVQLAEQYQVKLLPFLLQGVTAQQFQADNLHPTQAAQATLLNNVLPLLKVLLRN